MNTLLITLLEEINPLGLQHIATYLKDRGQEVSVIFAPLNPKEKDFGVEENRVIADRDISALLELISHSKPGLVGISLMTIHYHSAVKLTGEIKEAFPGIPVVWGGIHPTLLPEECIQHADMVCRGEGEVTMLELIGRIEKGESITEIKGLWVRSGEHIFRNEMRPLVEDLDSLGFPRFDWENSYILQKEGVRQLNMDFYQQCVPRKGRIYDIMTTRGCPYHCSYCCNAILKKLYAGKGKIVRSRSAENIIQELKYVKENFDFVKFINFQDDVFLERKKDKWLERFCREYKEKIGIPFVCKGSPREVTEENISLLKDAGLEYFHIGIQNSDRINKEIYKRNTSSRKQVIEASKILNKFKLVANYDVILDDPFTNEEDILEVLDTLTRLKKPFLLSCFSMTFFPNYEISRMAEEAGLLSKGKNGYHLKTTYASRSYLNNLVEISPRVPPFLIRFFVKYRKKMLAGFLLKTFIYFHYNFIFRAMYMISKYPRFLSFAKNIRFRLSVVGRQ